MTWCYRVFAHSSRVSRMTAIWGARQAFIIGFGESVPDVCRYSNYRANNVMEVSRHRLPHSCRPSRISRQTKKTRKRGIHHPTFLSPVYWLCNEKKNSYFFFVFSFSFFSILLSLSSFSTEEGQSREYSRDGNGFFRVFPIASKSSRKCRHTARVPHHRRRRWHLAMGLERTWRTAAREWMALETRRKEMCPLRSNSWNPPSLF